VQRDGHGGRPARFRFLTHHRAQNPNMGLSSCRRSRRRGTIAGPCRSIPNNAPPSSIAMARCRARRRGFGQDARSPRRSRT
jgi:hypothetical protein